MVRDCEIGGFCGEDQQVVEEKEPGVSARRRIAAVYRFLQSESTLVLSTCGAQGLAHATPLYYVAAENLDLYWISSKSSRHSLNLSERDGASVAVFRATFEWRRIAGVQMEGECAQVEEEERAIYLPAYRERFRLGALFSRMIALGTMYRFRPRWARYIDNSKRFGGRFEIELAGRGSLDEQRKRAGRRTRF